jgi:hypothetical protein
MCASHYNRWYRHADPSGGVHYRFGYKAMHDWLRRNRGMPKENSCVDCGQPAQEWSYDGDDPNERQDIYDGRIVTFSINPDRYEPRCRSCHRAKDLGGKTCSVEGCDRKHYGRGYCQGHWKRWQRHGDPLAGRAFNTSSTPIGDRPT